MKQVLIAGIASAAFVALTTPEASAHPKYTLSPLASLGKSGANTRPSSINEVGRVVGSGLTAYERCEDSPLCAYQHTILWSDGIPLDQHPFVMPGVSGANDINNAGQIVGGWEDSVPPYGGGACVWQDGLVTILPTLGGWTWATGVNDFGQIVGWSADPVENERRAVLWQHGELIELGTYPDGIVSYAEDINEAGQIVGTAALFGTSTNRRATLWQDGAMINLGTLTGGQESFALAINKAGQVVGWAEEGGLHDDRAVLWQQDPRTDEWMIVALSHEESRAHDINDRGQVVGTTSSVDYPYNRATLWENGETFDLNDLLAGNTGWFLRRAYAINNAGQIAGQGWDADGHYGAFLLTPIATPPTDADADIGFGELLALLRDWGLQGKERLR